MLKLVSYLPGEFLLILESLIIFWPGEVRVIDIIAIDLAACWMCFNFTKRLIICKVEQMVIDNSPIMASVRLW